MKFVFGHQIHDCRCDAKVKSKANMHLPDTTDTRVKNFKLDLRLWQMWRENNLHKTPWRGNAGFRVFRRTPSQHDARVDEIWPGKTERRRHDTLAAGRPIVWLLLNKCGSLKKDKVTNTKRWSCARVKEERQKHRTWLAQTTATEYWCWRRRSVMAICCRRSACFKGSTFSSNW